MAEIIFVLGGTRSGKTGFAQGLALEFEAAAGLPVTYIATAEAKDDEMKGRIARHRASRPPAWITREEPLTPAALFPLAKKESSALILDCMTLFVTNHLLRTEALHRDDAERLILEETDKILLAAGEGTVPVIIVSNEAGLGLVSSYELGRRFQDISGAVNQRVAALADRVYFLAAGLAQKLK